MVTIQVLLGEPLFGAQRMVSPRYVNGNKSCGSRLKLLVYLIISIIWSIQFWSGEKRRTPALLAS